MFDGLTSKLKGVVRKISGKNKVSADDISKTLEEVRGVLLEADVPLNVVKSFFEKVESRALGHSVLEGLNAGQTIIKIINEELVSMMGQKNVEINIRTQPPAVIMLVGLQGSGKTTSAAKLAVWLKNNKKKKDIMMVSTDVYRPAAMEQLKILGDSIKVPVIETKETEKPVDIAKRSIILAKQSFTEVLIVDTAGRLHVEDDLMQELKDMSSVLKPVETLLVIDAMLGQESINIADGFHKAIGITGSILSKIDGDSRGGVALSVNAVTGMPVKMMGTGEKIDDFEVFHPDRIASRILGMGDVLSLIEKAQKNIDMKDSIRIGKRAMSGQLNLEDYRKQLDQMKDMGGMEAILDKLPFGDNIASKLAQRGDMNQEFKRSAAIIDSMTPQERKFPDILSPSRKARITKGSGTNISDINKLLKSAKHMDKAAKQLKNKDKMKDMMRQLTGGKMPPF